MTQHNKYKQRLYLLYKSNISVGVLSQKTSFQTSQVYRLYLSHEVTSINFMYLLRCLPKVKASVAAYRYHSVMLILSLISRLLRHSAGFSPASDLSRSHYYVLTCYLLKQNRYPFRTFLSLFQACPESAFLR